MPRNSRRSTSKTSSRSSRSTAPVQVSSAPPPMQSQRPGLFGQMAATAAGVATGSAIGHTIGAGISSIFSGNNEVQERQYTDFREPQQQTCENDFKAYMRCMDTSSDPNSCSYYFENLKECRRRFNL